MSWPTVAIWLGLAGLGGFATILGSLMTLGTLLLWLIPSSRQQANGSGWQNRGKLLGVSVILMLSGLALLALMMPLTPNTH